MTGQQTLAQLVRAKYPDAYKDLSDQQLEAAVIAKYPGVYDDVPKTTAQAAAPQKPRDPMADAMRGPVLDIQKAKADPLISGFGKGALKGLVNLGDVFYEYVPGIARASDAVQRAVYGDVIPAQQLFDQARAELKPHGAAEKIGYGIEQAAEFFVPAGNVKRGAQMVAKYAPKLAVPARAATEAAAASTVAALQGVDPLTAGAVAGAVPVAGAALRHTAKGLSPGSKLTQVEREAVDFARKESIPIDAATATGSDFVSRQQALAGANIGGAGVAQAFKGAQEEALERVGRELAETANNAGMALEPVAASDRARKALTVVRDNFAKQQDDAYGHLRKLEEAATPTDVPGRATTITGQAATPAIDAAGNPITQGVRATARLVEPVRLAVDVGSRKDALRPMYDALERYRAKYPNSMSRAQQRAHAALEDLINGPDMAPLSVVDELLSNLKDLSRVKDGALRSKEQGAFAFIVGKLDDAVTDAARRGGPEVWGALQSGRKATIQKYVVNDIVESLSDGARPMFEQLTRQKDSGIELLREVAKHAPAEIPNLGRAFLEELMTKATQEGGFRHADALYASWKKLGPETRRMLFPDTAVDLDKFFLVNKMIAKNLNKSGTATTAAAQMNFWTPLTMVPTWALAKLMYTDRGVRVLTHSIQTGKTGGLSAALSRIGASMSGGLQPAGAR